MGRQIAIGDIHGCLKSLKTLLDDGIKPTQEDLLIFLGDYIDRGPDSKGVIDYLIRLEKEGYNCIFLRGNHEQTLLNALDVQRNLKKGFFSKPKNDILIAWRDSFGGQETLTSYGINNIIELPPEHEQWLNKLHYYHQSENYLFVHAGFNFQETDIFSDTQSMMWIREFEYDAHKAGGKMVVHGHVPVTLEFLQVCLTKPALGFIPLDTGCVYRDRPGYGYLSAYDITANNLFFSRNCD